MALRRTVSTLQPVDDDASISRLSTQHRLMLVRLAFLLMEDREAAEDVVQDAFTGMRRHRGPRDRRDPDRALACLRTAYLRTAVVNNSRSVLRRRRTARAYVSAEPSPAPSAETSVVQAEDNRTLRAAVSELPARPREVLVLRSWFDLSEAEIAETLGVSKGTVKSCSSTRALRPAPPRSGRCAGPREALAPLSLWRAARRSARWRSPSPWPGPAAACRRTSRRRGWFPSSR